MKITSSILVLLAVMLTFSLSLAAPGSTRPQTIAPGDMRQNVTPAQRLSSPSGGVPDAWVEIAAFDGVFGVKQHCDNESLSKMVAVLRLSTRARNIPAVPWVVTYANGAPLAQGTVNLSAGRFEDIYVKTFNPPSGEVTVIATIDPNHLVFNNVSPVDKRSASTQYTYHPKNCAADKKKKEEKKEEAPL